MFLKLTPVFLFAATLFVAPQSGDKDQAFRRFLSGMAQKEAREQAKKAKLAINQGGFVGQLELPNSDKIQVDISAFQLKNDTIKASVDVQGDGRISGTWTREGQSINIKADVSVKLSVTGSVLVEMQKSDFFLAPSLTDCDFKILKISIKEPAELADSDTLLIELANTAFQRNKSSVLSQINRSLKKYPIKF